jgi:AraC family transcriptional regulator
MPNQIFGHDQFLGSYESRWQTGGFSIARLFPTVPEEQVQEHTHSEAHYVLVMEGRYVSAAAGAPAVADHPILIYNPPGTQHRDRFRGDGGLFLTVTVSAPVLRCFADAVALPDYSRVPGRAALRAARHLMAASAASAGVGDLLMESLCAELLAATAMKRPVIEKHRPSWLWRVRELIHDDCGAALSLADIAAVAGVHPVYLTRAFRRHFGCTPGDYLRRCRLLKAAALLVDDRDDLVDIAGMCGYFDQAHFSRTFKTAFDLSPSQYRERVRRTSPGHG